MIFKSVSVSVECVLHTVCNITKGDTVTSDALFTPICFSIMTRWIKGEGNFFEVGKRDKSDDGTQEGRI